MLVPRLGLLVMLMRVVTQLLYGVDHLAAVAGGLQIQEPRGRLESAPWTAVIARSKVRGFTDPLNRFAFFVRVDRSQLQSWFRQGRCVRKVM
jgi:hypothetical protein